MATLGSINLNLGANVAGLEKGARRGTRAIRKFANDSQTSLSRANRSMGMFTRSTSGMSSGVVGVLGKAVPIIAAVTLTVKGLQGAFRSVTRAASAFTNAIRDQLGVIDDTAKAARKLGMSSAQLTTLQIAAREMSGIDSGGVSTAMQRMTRRIAEAANGMGEAQGALKEMKLDASELARKGPYEAFLKISDALKDVHSDADRLRLAFKLFDSEGAGLVNTLSGGRGAIEEVGRAAKASGLLMTSEQEKLVERFNDSYDRLKDAATGAFKQIAAEVAPQFAIVTEAVTKFIKDAKVGERLKSMFTGLLNAAPKVLDIIETFRAAWSAVISVASRATSVQLAAISQVADKLSKLAGVAGTANFAMNGSETISGALFSASKGLGDISKTTAQLSKTFEFVAGFYEADAAKRWLSSMMATNAKWFADLVKKAKAGAAAASPTEDSLHAYVAKFRSGMLKTADEFIGRIKKGAKEVSRARGGPFSDFMKWGDKFLKQFDRVTLKNNTDAPGAAHFGSVAAFSAARVNNAQQAMAEMQKRQLAEQKKIAKGMETLNNAGKQVVNFLGRIGVFGGK